MRIFSVHGCVIRIHPLFMCMLLFLCIGGATWPVAAFLAALILHEFAHFLCAIILHVQIAQLELTPFGGSMQIPLIDSLPPIRSFALSGAGPACNLLFFLSSLLVAWRFLLFHPFLMYFIQFNAAMLCINLLPVLPLDGGRMLLSLLTKYFDRARLLRIFLTAGRLLSLLLIAAGFLSAFYGIPRLSLTMLGVYLLYAAAIEEKTGVSRYLASFMARRIRFEKHKTLPVHQLCASASLPVFMLIAHLQPGAYHVVNVVQEDSLRLIGQMHEEALLSCILDHSQKTLGEMINANPA